MTEETQSTVLDKYCDEIKNTSLDDWVAKAIEDLTPEKLAQCIDENRNPFIEYFSPDYLSIVQIKEAIRARLHRDWGIIESYFTSPELITRTLIRKYPDNKAILTDNDKYLDHICWETYWFLRELVYRERETICVSLVKYPRINLDELRTAITTGENGIPLEVFENILDELAKEGKISIVVEWQEEEVKK